MCGICGIYQRQQKQALAPQVIHTMTNLLEHRGPDGEGYFLTPEIQLGHRRLSIIDLDTGDQPIYNEDNSICIVYNGEIYNFLAIRKKLQARNHHFATRSDTEVIVHAYEEYGVDCLHHFNGMFAFALWDARKKRLFLARDRLGIKPLYYAEYDGKFLFASEIKAILAYPNFPREPNPYSLVEHLTHQMIFGEKTAFKGIKLLQPGYYLMVTAGKITCQQYWALEFKKESQPEAYFLEQFRELFSDSVKLRLISDVPVGTYLSGGIDSSSVTTIANLLGKKKLKSFTGFFPEGKKFDEREAADALIQKLGIENYYIRIKPDYFVRYIEKIIWHLDEPRVTGGTFPIFMVSRLASQQVKVVLTGHGGDELFAGYPVFIPFYIRQHLTQALTTGKLSRLARLPGWICKGIQKVGFVRFWGFLLFSFFNQGLQHNFTISFFDRQLSSLLTRDFLSLIPGYDPYRYNRELIRKTELPSIFDKMTCFFVKNYISMLLLQEDKMDMAHSLEGRVPFLDHRLVGMAATIPDDVKLRDMELKHIVRQAMRPHLPPSLFVHKKQGFPIPFNLWVNKELKDFVYDTLLSTRARQRGIFNSKAITKILAQNRRGINRKQEIWNLLSIEIWFRMFFDEQNLSGQSEYFRQL